MAVDHPFYLRLAVRVGGGSSLDGARKPFFLKAPCLNRRQAFFLQLFCLALLLLNLALGFLLRCGFRLSGGLGLTLGLGKALDFSALSL